MATLSEGIDKQEAEMADEPGSLKKKQRKMEDKAGVGERNSRKERRKGKEENIRRQYEDRHPCVYPG